MSKMKEDLLHYLEQHGKPPVDYVLSKFEQHDIVLLGEMHRVKQQLELYHNLIPRLAEMGITYFATEFARRADQGLVDELLSKPYYDYALAKIITLKQEVFWGFQEYVDIFRLVWQTNQQVPPSQQIKIIGLNDPINWKLYNHICNTEHRTPNRAEIDVSWKGCGEKLWLEPITQHYAPGTKIMGIMGSHHGFTKYREPSWEIKAGKKVFTEFKTIRFGNHLYEKYGDKVFNICFHDPWSDLLEADKPIYPAKGVIEQVISPVYKEIGFDLMGSPWGEMTDDSFYTLGYPDFKLSNIYDGMIYTGRLQDLQPVTPIPDFIDESNIGLFRDFTPYNYEYNKTIAEINQIIADDTPLIYPEQKEITDESTVD
ncbi:MAG: hypothetical protein PHO32_05755 [Candidatus Cloacimonetes bacterium]|nr:hypothetical protein [Candidatus Cloacimonadota bacterium]